LIKSVIAVGFVSAIPNMEVAFRKGSKESLVALWKHEFFAVNKTKGKKKGKKEVDIYQALEFRMGVDLPEKCRIGCSDKESGEIWVQGVFYAPACDIRRANCELRKDRFIFQKDAKQDWEPCPQYKASLGDCPELVKLKNCTCWHPMSDVLHMLPRVVHPSDVQTQKVYVKGRDWHYLCGVTAIEDLSPAKGEDGFALEIIDRKRCVMYPEEILGGVINSASSQWENVEQLFQGIRDIMSSGTGYTSGTFSIAWTNGCQKFWEVVIVRSGCCVMG
jgi:hypothetical protein